MDPKRSSVLVIAVLALAACSGDKGDPGPAGGTGPQGPGGTSSGTVAGVVTVAGTSPAVPVAGATVAVSPAVAGVAITTAANGSYTASLPVGVYTLTYQATNFTSQTKSVSVTAGQTATQNVALAATAPVVVSIAVTGSAAPGAALNATATITPLDGSTVTAGSAAWSQLGGTPVTFGSAAATTTAVTLGSVAGYKDELFKALAVSPLQDPDDDPAVGGEGGTPFLGGLKDRFKVQAVNHFDLERAGEVSLKFQVATSSGTYSATALVHAALPWGVATGTAQVPVGEAVIIHGKDQATYAFTLTPPAGSTATLDDAASQHPAFTPDVAGNYTIAEAGGFTTTVVAAEWVGALGVAPTLAALDAAGQGNPVGSANCTICHRAGGLAPDMFTPWSRSGHAQIFTQNVNAGGHYSEACFDCHTVGFNPAVANNGVEEQSDYDGMLAGIFTEHGSPLANPLNWKSVLTSYANTAAMLNIQCENCHGPGSTHDGSAAEKGRRVSLDAGVCGRCHGEPSRHGRYQEWQLSRHADYETAVGEGFTSAGALRTTCAGCHTAQGALQWFRQLRAGNPSRTLDAASVAALATMTPENVQPQTCAVCHDPHDPGSISSLGNDVNLRISGDSPLLPGGFRAVGMGKGAMCITCHNSRNGEATAGSGVVNLHEDGDAAFGTLAAFSAPHEACQGDVFMGRNAYFVRGVRSAHSNIENTCTACHMESVPPPPELGYPSQTNHTFEANLTICSRCHGSFDGAGLQHAVEAELAGLKTAIETALTRVYFPGQVVVFSPGRSPTISLDGGAAEAFLTAVPLDENTDTFAKANWNYSLIEQDFSKGVHNPSFAHEVLFATTAKVDAIPAPPP